MTTLAAIPVCDDQLDLLSEIADTQSPLGSLHADDFRAACAIDASENGGWVHPSRVHLILHNRFGEINVRWFSTDPAGSALLDADAARRQHHRRTTK